MLYIVPLALASLSVSMWAHPPTQLHMDSVVYCTAKSCELTQSAQARRVW